MKYEEVGKELLPHIIEYEEAKEDAHKDPQSYKKNNRFAQAYQNVYDAFTGVYRRYRKEGVE